MINDSSILYTQEVALWKKLGLIILVASEIGLTPFLAEAVSQSVDIFIRVINRPSLVSTQAETIFGYSLATAYALTAMLSVGNIDESIKKLINSDQQHYELGVIFKTVQTALIGLAFFIGSTAAAVGVIQRWGNTWPFYLLASFNLIGQLTLVLLQANKRILSSAVHIKKFLAYSNKRELLKNNFTKPLIYAAINTLSNTLYWGAFYYYLGANISESLNLSTINELTMGFIFAGLGAYMAFCTQGIDEIMEAYQNSIKAYTHETINLINRPTFLSLILIFLSFICRTIATIALSYSLMAGKTESLDDFNKMLGIVALAMIIPGATSAFQYVKYVHNQVNDAVAAIKSCLNCNKYSFFNSKKPNLLINDNDKINISTEKTPLISKINVN